MTTTKTEDQIVLDYLTEGPLYRTPEQLREDEHLIRWAIQQGREGYVPEPAYPRTVWGVRRANGGPVTTYQTEELARWYLVRMDKRDIKAYGVELVKGVEYSTQWGVVDTIGPV